MSWTFLALFSRIPYSCFSNKVVEGCDPWRRRSDAGAHRRGCQCEPHCEEGKACRWLAPFQPLLSIMNTLKLSSITARSHLCLLCLLLQNKYTPLHQAAGCDQVEAMQVLVAVGADVNAITRVSHPPFFLPLLKNLHITFVFFLRMGTQLCTGRRRPAIFGQYGFCWS